MKWLKQLFKIIGKRNGLCKWLKEIESYTKLDSLVSQLPKDDNVFKHINFFEILYKSKAIVIVDWRGTIADYMFELKELHILKEASVNFEALENKLNALKKKDVVRFIRATDKFIEEFKFLTLNTRSDSYGIIAIPKGKTQKFRELTRSTGIFKATLPTEEPVIEK